MRSMPRTMAMLAAAVAVLLLQACVWDPGTVVGAKGRVSVPGLAGTWQFFDAVQLRRVEITSVDDDYYRVVVGTVNRKKEVRTEVYEKVYLVPLHDKDRVYAASIPASSKQQGRFVLVIELGRKWMKVHAPDEKVIRKSGGLANIEVLDGAAISRNADAADAMRFLHKMSEETSAEQHQYYERKGWSPEPNTKASVKRALELLRNADDEGLDMIKYMMQRGSAQASFEFAGFLISFLERNPSRVDPDLHDVIARVLIDAHYSNHDGAALVLGQYLLRHPEAVKRNQPIPRSALHWLSIAVQLEPTKKKELDAALTAAATAECKPSDLQCTARERKLAALVAEQELLLDGEYETFAIMDRRIALEERKNGARR